MKRKALKFHYITLLIFCQALAFYILLKPATAAANEITITCPTETTANSDINCTLGGKTTSLVNNITLTINPSNLQIKEFKPASGWTNSGSSKTILNLSSATEANSSFSLGTLILTSTSASQSETITLENVEFQKTDNYRFNATGVEISIKITEAPVTPTCAADEELVNGVCVKKQKICATDEELVDGQCVKKTPTCTDDEELIDGECVKKTPTCADDEEFIDGECIKKENPCKESEEFIDGECVEKKITCEKDEELVDGECVKKKPICKSDEELINGKCVKKIITPICKDDEELIDNTCQKKKPEIDWTLIAIIAGGSILIIGIIIAIILVIKKGKKGAGMKGYTSFSNSPNLSTGFRSTSVQSSTENYSSGTRAQTNLTQSPTTNTSTSGNSSNGTFLARSGEIVEGQAISATNTDPRLQIQMQNSNQNITPNPTNPSNPLTNKIEQGAAMASYDDPRLQYNFSENRPVMPTTQSQTAPIQAPIVSAYDVATQAASRPEQQPQQIIQATPTTPSQPTGPTINQSYQRNPLVQNSQYRPTASVPLTAPNDPTVFES